MKTLAMTLLLSGSLFAAVLGLAMSGLPAKAATGPGYEPFFACCYGWDGSVTVQVICVNNPFSICRFQPPVCSGHLGFCPPDI